MEVDFPKFSKLPRANFLVDPSRFRDQDAETFRPEEVLRSVFVLGKNNETSILKFADKPNFQI